jgi:ABC-type sulfate transport system substrate-binding protein
VVLQVTKTNDSAFNQKGTKPVRHLSHQIRQEWQELWEQKIEDKIVAEDVARRNYELLFVERGTVIQATKDYQPLDLREIMEKNEKVLGIKLTQPNPHIGGWRKFSKDVLAKQARWHQAPPRDRQRPSPKTPAKNRKHAGRGWLHK